MKKYFKIEKISKEKFEKEYGKHARYTQSETIVNDNDTSIGLFVNIDKVYTDTVEVFIDDLDALH